MEQSFKSKITLIHLLLITGILIGCVSASKKNQTDSLKHYSLIALLPFDNQTNNIEASEKVRIALFNEMKLKKFRLIELDKIDTSLKEFGITDGGQLGSVSVERLREKISADWFCYGTVMEFGQKSAVAFTQRKVKIKLKFVESQTGKVVFEGTEVGITSRAGTDAAGDLVVLTAGKVMKSVKEGAKKLLPGKTLKKTADLTDEIADVDLKNETQEAILKLLNRFPQ